MEIPAETSNYLLWLVSLAVIGVLSFLVKRAFDELETGMKTAISKIDDLKSSLASQDTAHRLLEQRVTVLERRRGRR